MKSTTPVTDSSLVETSVPMRHTKVDAQRELVDDLEKLHTTSCSAMDDFIDGGRFRMEDQSGTSGQAAETHLHV